MVPLNPVSVGQVPETAGITGAAPVVFTGPVPFDPPSAEPPLEFPELVPLLLFDSPPLPPPSSSPGGAPLELPLELPFEFPLELPPDAPTDPFELLEVPVPVPESDPKSEVLLPPAHATT